MVNQTVAIVPPNIEDTDALRRCLTRTIEQLDVVVGNRSSSTYTALKDIEELKSSLIKITKQLDSIETTIKENTKRILALEKA